MAISTLLWPPEAVSALQTPQLGSEAGRWTPSACLWQTSLLPAPELLCWHCPRCSLSQARPLRFSHRKQGTGLRVGDACLLEQVQQTPGCVLRDSHVGDCSLGDVEGAAGLPHVHL